MSISFYDTSVGSYQQVLGSVAAILDKGAAFAAENEIELSEIVATKLRDDMMPFHFQIVSVCHHSWGALQGMRDGRFLPPSFELDKDYQGLQSLVGEAQEGVASISESEVNELAEKSMVFAIGDREILPAVFFIAKLLLSRNDDLRHIAHVGCAAG